jgi:predicted CXXCH cytochrome family protein
MQCHNGDQNDACASEVHCGDCHEHNNQFQGVNANLDCEQCHNQGQGTLPIITTQFDKLSKHIPGGSTDAVKANCVVCHDNYGHTGLYVLDADDGTQYSTGVPGHDTLATPVNETFEPHCLSCHDDASADSLPASGTDQTQDSPFTGTNPATFAQRIIDETAWTNSLHNRRTDDIPAPTGPFGPNPVSCVGDGTNGCHGSGHGSDQNSLLTPVTGALRSTDQVCFECHDADGPSSYNIFALFDPVANDDWQVTSASGAKANQRHDVSTADQVYSGATLGCQGCHDVHADNVTVINPDTGLGLSTYNYTNYRADVNQLDPINPEGSAGGFSEPDYVEYCLVCHDNSPPPGVTMPTNALIDIASVWLDAAGDAHGMGPGGSGGSTAKGGLKAPYVNAAADAIDDDPSNPYAAMNCTTCHGPHGSVNIFNLRSEIDVAGVQMTVGGFGPRGGILDEPHYFGSTTYTLPLIDGAQTDHFWGAWCTFCHKMDSHPTKTETEICNGPHMHGQNGF